ncbi:MAG: hypothetical protein UX78_C0005G0047 [Candidatus Amesbacteria bacterium GW2011_GWA2_47_11]|uniref:Uncharacterized protein n=2 Tax=Candidatus Amesiibacteriota TaxID=1752730 RepID=A0A1F4Z8A1_9BACT|nr:MAG: hypothetical protein UX78_C0005G0047 [Candidatus Amesbacteria bacterium GW2011_GWA2_47_11]OGD02388.1 MAG: hypothetical protein A3E17_04835 [Candidatus Amesbacteria bacterium RIFCSPHIGHO2_12_FULL_48_14]OGD06383.1 MAG: hypothetical protein A3B58_01130 [Candidatus Amesbacteria bacterium RIFCSPLOWO2_01_FULL_48_50]
MTISPGNKVQAGILGHSEINSGGIVYRYRTDGGKDVYVTPEMIIGEKVNEYLSPENEREQKEMERLYKSGKISELEAPYSPPDVDRT